MKKFLWPAVVCAAILLGLAGCRAGLSSSAPSAGVSSVPSSGAVSSAAPVSSSSAAESSSGQAAEIDRDAFDSMVNAMLGYEPGTAGATLKLYLAACGVLNFSEGYDPGQEASLRSALQDALTEMEPDRQTQLAETFSAVDGAASGIVENGVDSVAGILADAGDPNQYDSYDAGRYELVREILREELGVQE